MGSLGMKRGIPPRDVILVHQPLQEAGAGAPPPVPSSLLSSTRMISFSSCVGVWLTALWTDRRITDRASFTKMKMMDIWGSSLLYLSSLHLGGERRRVESEEGGKHGTASDTTRVSAQASYVFSQGTRCQFSLSRSWLRPENKTKEESIKGSSPISPKLSTLYKCERQS